MQHTLTPNQRSLLAEFCSDFELHLRTEYSGRGMFGVTCIGFCHSQYTSPFMLGMELGRFLSMTDEGTDLADHIEVCHTDSMGRDMIIYFPKLQWNLQNELVSTEQFSVA